MSYGDSRLASVRVLGVMTGTSCDGLDAACVEFVGGQLEWKRRRLWVESAVYPSNLRKRVLSIQEPCKSVTLLDYLKLHRDLGEWYGQTLGRILKNQPKGRTGFPDVIANHGQTVAHYPKIKMSLQLGDPTRIACATGLTVVSNFRDGDMAGGGQGAPLVPLFHRMMAAKFATGSTKQGKKGIAIHNLGGISNLTYIGPQGRLLAFDSGPGNVLIDGAAEIASRGKLKMDRNGLLAAQGEVNNQALRKLLKHRFFALPPPKSTGRDEFNMPWFLSALPPGLRGNSLVATATALTVESIARAYERFILCNNLYNNLYNKKMPLGEIYLCGGGAKNPTLVQWLQRRLPDIKIFSDCGGFGGFGGFDAQFVEAEAFAVFGFLSLLGQPLGGEWTGAKKWGPPGHIIPGKNWLKVVAKLERSHLISNFISKRIAPASELT